MRSPFFLAILLSKREIIFTNSQKFSLFAIFGFIFTFREFLRLDTILYNFAG